MERRPTDQTSSRNLNFTMSFLRLYRSLPVIKQLTAIREELNGLKQHLRLVESANLIQVLETLKAGNNRYRDPKRLLVHGAQYWSQNFEDGMLAEIFRRLGTISGRSEERRVGKE